MTTVDYAPRARLTPTPRVYGYTELLTPDGYNPKLKHGRDRGYSSAILHLAPAVLSGYEVCSARSAGCTASCLNTAGHGGIALDASGLNDVQRARIARTHLLFRQRDTFFSELVLAIETHVRRARANGLVPMVRLNGTSDLPWERMPFTDVDGTRYASIFARFPDVTFYDYTKHVERAILSGLGALPANYSLTFSRCEDNEHKALDVLANGGNVAVVFNARTKHAKRAADAFPATWHGYSIFDGDNDDLRPLDPRNVVVGLRAKGRGKLDRTGFVVDVRSDACSPACGACGSAIGRWGDVERGYCADCVRFEASKSDACSPVDPDLTCRVAHGTCSTDPFYDTRLPVAQRGAWRRSA